jgi:hypothetical protein
MMIMPKEEGLSAGQFVSKFLVRLFLCFVVFAFVFLFLLGAGTTDNYNFCVSDESADSNWIYWALQHTVFDTCKTDLESIDE